MVSGSLSIPIRNIIDEFNNLKGNSKLYKTINVVLDTFMYLFIKFSVLNKIEKKLM